MSIAAWVTGVLLRHHHLLAYIRLSSWAVVQHRPADNDVGLSEFNEPLTNQR